MQQYIKNKELNPDKHLLGFFPQDIDYCLVNTSLKKLNLFEDTLICFPVFGFRILNMHDLVLRKQISPRPQNRIHLYCFTTAISAFHLKVFQLSIIFDIIYLIFSKYLLEERA